MDSSKYKKPDHVKDYLWRQHLDWMKVVGEQVEENIKKRQKEIENSRTTDQRR